jgi:hypothetical protein
MCPVSVPILASPKLHAKQCLQLSASKSICDNSSFFGIPVEASDIVSGDQSDQNFEPHLFHLPSYKILITKQREESLSSR